jgi:hypothetical protein
MISKMNHMNKIIDGLYLGSFEAANDKRSLKAHGITHILTVADELKPLFTYVCSKYHVLI